MNHFLMGYRVLYKMMCGTEMIGRLSDSMILNIFAESQSKLHHTTDICFQTKRQQIQLNSLGYHLDEC